MGAWSLLSFGEDRHFQGNTGYADEVESFYLYDSTVQNSRRLAVGDLVVLRGKVGALGVAWIQGIDVETGRTKIRKSCPACERTRFKLRTGMSPRFRCQRCTNKFDVPVEKVIDVTTYVANYAGTWRTLDGAITKESLNSIAENDSQQQSIRPLDRAALELMLDRLHVPLEPLSEVPRKKIDGGRQLAVTFTRTGQEAFRRELLRKYGFLCAVTGQCPGETLEAAHLRAFAEHESHDVDEGLLLRVDVHRLFDRGLLAVHPETLEVHLAPKLRSYPAYEALHGGPLTVAPPSKKALADHFKVATATWA